MAIWHTSLVDRFPGFPKHQQLLMVCNELRRANAQQKRPDYYKKHLELALELMDFLIDDRKQWSYAYRELMRAREVLAEYYISAPNSTDSLVRTLISLTPDTAGVKL